MTTSQNTPLTLRRVIAVWWPLAASWLLMAAEVPALSAVIARLSEPKIHLAAYSGIVFPLALLIESPIIMLLAASTALSKDWASYRKIYRFMMVTGAVLTALHVLVAFTPLYYVVARGVLGAPQEIIEPGRIGLMLMTPWSWSIAYRRFHQGVLIRFGHSRTVGTGTIIRLAADGLVLAGGYAIGTIPGIVVASAAVATGVISEAVYAGWVVRPVLREELRQATAVSPALTLKSFLAFYVPLVLTSLLTLIANPINSAAMSRMPQAVASLAAWSVLNGLVFLLRSAGIAYNEVIVALLDTPGSSPNLRRFAGILAAVTSGALLLVAATPLAGWWFGWVSGLDPALAELARRAVWLGIPLPALSVLQSWFQGAILHGRKTNGITASVVLYLFTSAVALAGGVVLHTITGLYVGLAAMTLSVFTQTLCLWWASRDIRATVHQRDARRVFVPALSE